MATMANLSAHRMHTMDADRNKFDTLIYTHMSIEHGHKYIKSNYLIFPFSLQKDPFATLVSLYESV